MNRIVPPAHEVCGRVRGSAGRRGDDPPGAVGVDGAAAAGHRAQVGGQGRQAQVLGAQGEYSPDNIIPASEASCGMGYGG